MSKPSRGSLSSLSSRLAPKGDAVPPATATTVGAGEVDTSTTSEATPAATAVPDFKSMMCRVNRAGWREMSRLALELDANLEDMLIAACNDYLTKHGRPPVIEKRSPNARKPAS